MKFNYLIVGAGLAGLTFANLLAQNENNTILIIEKRQHIGGNAYDSYNANHILIHNYGPHIFHTNNQQVWKYLSQFTEWQDYQHRVLSFVDGQFIPMPITLETINQLYNTNLSQFEMADFIESQKEKVELIKSSEDVALSNAGRDIYEKFFMNYTTKQWGVSPSELDPSVISRIPFRFNRDTRYFTDRYQGIPKAGYTKMCEQMIDRPNIKVMLNTDYKEVTDAIDYDKMIYTGPVDYFYDNQFGKLKYRSVRFEMEDHDCESFQDAAVVNYPNDYDFTRITEYKKITGQQHLKTTVMKEFPCDGEEPFYPFPTKEWQECYLKYKAKADVEENVVFAGRLAEYRYYNMDVVVARAMEMVESISSLSI
ncbi:UDP-galactopyranose mutase [Acetobacterium tundrae]|uniref:UDP-galactopyranose mutase n=1 Tax=Acetobacterium tundrae TaxID=132932 RepID=A0ABR6WIJ6_9FIRM|nr:UDP-galactopyranose mutase [Acetobacterium tundrae]MBC3796108.1 UDP-galactopyranose mutase [Acetobacterium tundrae]